jgi:FixJ family two-component response regulator
MTKCEPNEHERSKLIVIVDDDEALQDSLRGLMEVARLVAQWSGSAGGLLESGFAPSSRVPDH